MATPNPPRLFGLLLALLGAALAVGGIGLLRAGDSAYFLAVGLGAIATGVLIALGRLLGAWVYGATLALVVVWSLAEVGADLPELLPRVALPILIGVYVFSGRIRDRLA